MSSIEFGLCLPTQPRVPRETYLKHVRESLDIVSGHFRSIWFPDHLQFQDAPVLEGWTALTYLAACYPAFQFGHVVLSQSFRNPALLAKMVATAQYLSEGRFVLGIGTGWNQEEHESYRFPFPKPGERLDRLEETLRILKALWTQPRTTFEGKHYQVVNAACEPKPDPIPRIMIGGSQPRMLRLIARYADEWNSSHVDIPTYRERIRESERACAEVGRDPATLRRSWLGGCYCVPEGADVSNLDLSSFRSPNPQWKTPSAHPFVGTPGQIIEKLKPYIDLGVTSFLIKNERFPDTTSLRLLVEEILPRLNALV
jgi:alkanesulfonate monooxygenase SsuD/methylene tetrahydromethanopterin reductase-like flavin-dependent oxidoreductase (luciferase family)